jgi:hypothetical protein
MIVAHKHRYVSCMDLVKSLFNVQELPKVAKVKDGWWDGEDTLLEDVRDFDDFKDKIIERN